MTHILTRPLYQGLHCESMTIAWKVFRLVGVIYLFDTTLLKVGQLASAILKQESCLLHKATTPAGLCQVDSNLTSMPLVRSRASADTTI